MMTNEEADVAASLTLIRFAEHCSDSHDVYFRRPLHQPFLKNAPVLDVAATERACLAAADRKAYTDAANLS